jgi:hypothetical protein
MIKKKKNTLKLILISIAGLFVLGWFLVPVLVKNYAIKNSKELLGRQIDVDGLRLNFFTGNMHLTGFEMYEPDDQTVFVSFDTLNVNIEPYQFVFNKKVVEQFYLQGLYVNIIQQDSTFNFDDLIAFHSAEEEPEEPEDETSFKYLLSNLELKDAHFVYEDRDIDHITDINDFSFFIPQISWDQEEKSNADIKFNFKQEGYLESSLNINPVDGQYDARVKIYHLYLNPFLKRFQEYAEVTAVEGYLDTDLDIFGNINEVEKSIVSGRTVLNGFFMKDTDSKEFLSADQIICTLQEIDYYNDSYRIDTLAFTKPYLFFELDSISNNIFQIFKMDSDTIATDVSESETREMETDSTSQSDLFYAINHLAINSGTVDYTDNLTGQPFNYHLSEVLIKTDSIFSNSDWIEINADMLLNERGTLKARLGYDPIGLLDGELNISVEKFLLPDLNIYTKHYVGHTMVEGDMFYYSDSKVVNGNIESENKLIIKQPTVNNTKGGLFSLPLKLALWLLTDKNGDVTLNVPVRGDLNNPEIDVWKLVWSTFRNKITDTADNPVSSLAPLVGADPKELQSIDFKFADTLVTDQHIKQLNWLVELEKKKEGLSIDLNYFVDDELQQESLVGLGLEKETDSLSTRTPDSLAQVPGHDVELLSKKYSSARIIGIRNYLDSIYSDTRIKTTGRDSVQPQNTGSFPTFKINFSLDSERDSLN